MTRKQLDTMREVRLWTGQMVIPAIALGIMVMTIPGVREKVYRKKKAVKDYFNKKRTVRKFEKEMRKK